MRLGSRVVAVTMVWVFLAACGGPQTSKTVEPPAGPSTSEPTPPSVANSSPTDAPKPQKLETANQAIERSNIVLPRLKGARYEATHLDAWMPTVPTSTDTPRGAWKVKQYNASDKYVGWVVLDEITGDPLQVGHTGGD
jgi:hypothetical protein